MSLPGFRQNTIFTGVGRTATVTVRSRPQIRHARELVIAIAGALREHNPPSRKSYFEYVTDYRTASPDEKRGFVESKGS
jgi:hypothetical protein